MTTNLLRILGKWIALVAALVALKIKNIRKLLHINWCCITIGIFPSKMEIRNAYVTGEDRMIYGMVLNFNWLCCLNLRYFNLIYWYLLCLKFKSWSRNMIMFTFMNNNAKTKPFSILFLDMHFQPWLFIFRLKFHISKWNDCAICFWTDRRGWFGNPLLLFLAFLSNVKETTLNRCENEQTNNDSEADVGTACALLWWFPGSCSQEDDSCLWALWWCNMLDALMNVG